MIIKCYIRRVLSTGCETIKFLKSLKGSGATRARISNIKSRKKRIEHRSRIIEKEEVRKKDFLFQNQKNREDTVRLSMR